MAQIVWTPEKSVMGLGTVLMDRPVQPLTLDQYRWALAARIDRMVQEAGDDAPRLLRKTVEYQEIHMTVATHLGQVGEIMAWDSDQLTDQSGMLGENWPLAPGKVRQQVEPTAEDLEQMDLEEYLGRLYSGL